MIVVADPRYKREIYHDHGLSRCACMSSPVPNGGAQSLGVTHLRATASDVWLGRHVKLPAPVLRVTGKCLRTWWKIRKPATFGVKVLLIHPGDPAQCLIVRHSYSDSARWGMPGGGYRPGRETPQQAGVREVAEELALTVTEVPTVLDTVSTMLEGKRDTLTIVQATPVSASFVRSPEIAEARWVRADMAAMPQGEPVSRWLERALSARNAPGPARRSSSAQEGR